MQWHRQQPNGDWVTMDEEEYTENCFSAHVIFFSFFFSMVITAVIVAGVGIKSTFACIMIGIVLFFVLLYFFAVHTLKTWAVALFLIFCYFAANSR